jgi:hypothetical protein
MRHYPKVVNCREVALTILCQSWSSTTVITEFHDPATHGNIIPPRIADGSLSSGLNHPPAAYKMSTSRGPDFNTRDPP